jgi:endogenous inhibitor of DNA gyrase (YacG/DUF329 family)
MSADTKGPRVIRCPGCFGPSIYSTDNAFRPFCSVRCKNNDFGAWASEGYAVPADPDPDLPEPDVDVGGPLRH